MILYEISVQQQQQQLQQQRQQLQLQQQQQQQQQQLRHMMMNQVCYYLYTEKNLTHVTIDVTV